MPRGEEALVAERAAPDGVTRPRCLAADYPDLELDEDFDLIPLISGDLCALSPAQRARLHESIRAWLAPGGSFAFDVFSKALFDQVEEEAGYTFEPDGLGWEVVATLGSWAGDPYDASRYDLAAITQAR